ncbi:hypothetical protein JCM24511_00856 [Saitozyma sp. JCM 24511]|nr:hypothetical protein JCM24511_00856 [Saitozyma sp. JCM 24511]
MKTIIATALVATLARHVLASTYVVCVASSSFMSYPQIPGTFTTNDACVAACTTLAGGGGYSFFLDNANTCYCTGDDIFPDVSNVETGTGSTTQPCPASEGLATRIPTDFQFVDCFRDTTGTGITHIGFVATPQACFDACNLFPQAFYNVISPSGFDCSCADLTVAGDGSRNCQAFGMNSIYFFSGHNVPSGVSRRRAAQLALMRQQEAICPDGLKACKVPGGSADAFECIDTQFNDESCGGCVAGDYPPVPFSHFGTNCLTLDGVLPGGVTCSSGVCQTTHCQTGYELVEGQCVPVS